ncbi:MAG: preprotein translocase subunit SecG [Alphaproteobacteria bacterium]|nr:preprotein translocase subunit SecG [Alphaproteobacteria bacterium]
MTTILLVIHVFITLLLIGTILLQKSEGGGLGSSGGQGNSAFSPRGAANFLSRTTAFLAALFFCMCIVLKWHSNERVAYESNIITKK